MIGRSYFARQAQTLLKLARSVKNPDLSAELIVKAADLEEKAQDASHAIPVATPALCDRATE